MTIPVRGSIIIEFPSDGSAGWQHRVLDADTGEEIHGVLGLWVRVSGSNRVATATLTQLVNEEGEPVVQGIAGPDGQALRGEFNYAVDHYRLRSTQEV